MSCSVRSGLLGFYALLGACATATIGGDGPGPTRGVPWGSAGHGGQASCPAEVCDGFDNDCDGLVDEDCPCEDGDEQACYTGSAITVDIGPCRTGTQLCEGSSWGPCLGEVPPAEEQCDGFDNDCDGQVDEACPCEDGAEQTCYTGSPVTVDIGPCRSGTQICQGDTWGPCEGDVTPADEECDDQDHDCDGVDGIENHAVDLGILSDVAADLETVMGNSTPWGHSRWWTFVGADDTDSSGDEFHVDVRFLDNPGDAYEMDVYRGPCAPNNQLAAGETSSFDWFTNFDATSSGCTQSAPCGEGNCEPAPPPDGINSCDDDTAQFYVRVRRTDGQPSADEFTLEISNGVY